MKNIKLNPGGLIGALLCFGVAIAIIFTNASLRQGQDENFRIPIFALIGGAFAGNFLWDLIFRRDS